MGEKRALTVCEERKCIVYGYIVHGCALVRCAGAAAAGRRRRQLSLSLFTQIQTYTLVSYFSSFYTRFPTFNVLTDVVSIFFRFARVRVRIPSTIYCLSAPRAARHARRLIVGVLSNVLWIIHTYIYILDYHHYRFFSTFDFNPFPPLFSSPQIQSTVLSIPASVVTFARFRAFSSLRLINPARVISNSI